MKRICICLVAFILMQTGCSSLKPDSVAFSAYAQSDYAFVKVGLVWGPVSTTEATEDSYLQGSGGESGGSEKGSGGSGGCDNCHLK